VRTANCSQIPVHLSLTPFLILFVRNLFGCTLARIKPQQRPQLGFHDENTSLERGRPRPSPTPVQSWTFHKRCVCAQGHLDSDAYNSGPLWQFVMFLRTVLDFLFNGVKGCVIMALKHHEHADQRIRSQAWVWKNDYYFYVKFTALQQITMIFVLHAYLCYDLNWKLVKTYPCGRWETGKRHQWERHRGGFL